MSNDICASVLQDLRQNADRPARSLELCVPGTNLISISRSLSAMQTYVPKGPNQDPKWFLVDADGQ
ncbi:MAG TPA: hypothetical protein VFP98_05010, partial [Candidatus Polarisedimenticolia bacterium]|nr:hypothetical protein [Candidatus Polarisedimenticolia bacterium]